MAIEARPASPGGGRASLRRRLVKALASCATEADIVQTLYAELRPEFGYDVVVLHVLEREGWHHATPIDRGVLQDVSRQPIAKSSFAPYYEHPRTVVSHQASGDVAFRARGPG